MSKFHSSDLKIHSRQTLKYIWVSSFYHSLSFRTWKPYEVCALTHIFRCNYCTQHARTHTFAELSEAAICEFIKAFGRLLGVCAVWLNCYRFPACHLYGTHRQWPHAWRLEHRPALQLWQLCRGRKTDQVFIYAVIYHICSALCSPVLLRVQSKLSNSWMSLTFPGHN